LRVLHSARYGGDGADPRLLSNFLGSSYFVRGHRQDLRFCRPEAARVCGDDLLGSRLLVGNLEVRVPLWGIQSREIDYGMFPADVFVFADAGRVWSGSGNRAQGAGATIISSFGGGVRVNALGFPMELAAIRAVDGPRPRWQFDWGFRVGF
jgi:outer membrane protein assembly factor BamA